ncbi:hypothetical protein BEWA_010990 [Theileria equi strain WA]|uniref:Uncharacterized protein n=1 Tax=Theileria equi strain WA TaxID=1537102 RepID=L0B380_THEEQ|nr:hypothetical protein BEWA_010990 [Theileria equi strain WA]AFZ81681.1 hypothetical protein BEWA_010990 [Theileria equi strain WA]|eukprot:XP_004831347.1 hypothetical protein BEWA_010990 [Theileria equi strain WA]
MITQRMEETVDEINKEKIEHEKILYELSSIKHLNQKLEIDNIVHVNESKIKIEELSETYLHKYELLDTGKARDLLKEKSNLILKEELDKIELSANYERKNVAQKFNKMVALIILLYIISLKVEHENETFTKNMRNLEQKILVLKEMISSKNEEKKKIVSDQTIRTSHEDVIK